MTTTATARPPRLPREEDFRNPNTRLAALLTARLAALLAVLLSLLLVTACGRPAAEVTAPDPVPASAGVVRCEVSAPQEVERARLRASCERAAPMVAGIWPGWTGPVRVVLATSDLGPGTAALVEGRAREGGPTQGDRVLVAPAMTEELSAEGLDVVLRHELAHLAMRATGTSSLPRWASEGFAEHVAYLGVTDARAQRRDELQRLREGVEGDRVLASAPHDVAFDDTAEHADAYVAAWLTMEVLVEHLGRERVVEALGRAQVPTQADAVPPGSDGGRTQALLSSLGLTRSWLAERWRAELRSRTA